MGDSPRFAVRFDAEALAEDLAHASAAGRLVAERERARLQRDGIATGELLRCEALARDGTRLAGCVKTYRPWPAGRWGMVFRGWRDDEPQALLCIAFGQRHPISAWQPSVYKVADRRLHGAAFLPRAALATAAGVSRPRHIAPATAALASQWAKRHRALCCAVSDGT